MGKSMALNDKKKKMEDGVDNRVKELEDQHRAEFAIWVASDSKINSEVAIGPGRGVPRTDWDQANLELTDSHTAEKKELRGF